LWAAFFNMSRGRILKGLFFGAIFVGFVEGGLGASINAWAGQGGAGGRGPGQILPPGALGPPRGLFRENPPPASATWGGEGGGKGGAGGGGSGRPRGWSFGPCRGGPGAHPKGIAPNPAGPDLAEGGQKKRAGARWGELLRGQGGHRAGPLAGRRGTFHRGAQPMGAGGGGFFCFFFGGGGPGQNGGGLVPKHPKKKKTPDTPNRNFLGPDTTQALDGSYLSLLFSLNSLQGFFLYG